MGIETIQYLTTIRFGEGAVAALANEADALGIVRPLVITDAPLMALGLVERVLAAFATPPAIFDGTPSNPTEAAVDAAAEIYRAQDCDGLVAIGGGSPIDLAKAVALRVSHDGPLAEYAAIAGGLERITAACAPVIAVPTTSGTGAEVGRASLLTVADGRKLGLISPHLIPKLAICDPELTYALPAGLTAATGMDAITHCFETFLSPKDNPVAEAIALDGLERGWHHIARATVTPGETVARREMMMASLQGGLTFQKGLGGVHSLSHPLGAVKAINAHHGTLNAILLPALLRYNMPVAEAKCALIRARLGMAPDADLATEVTALVTALGLPVTLGALGFDAGMLADIPALAVADHSTPTNAREIDAAAFAAILAESL